MSSYKSKHNHDDDRFLNISRVYSIKKNHLNLLHFSSFSLLKQTFIKPFSSTDIKHYIIISNF